MTMPWRRKRPAFIGGPLNTAWLAKSNGFDRFTGQTGIDQAEQRRQHLIGPLVLYGFAAYGMFRFTTDHLLPWLQQ